MIAKEIFLALDPADITLHLAGTEHKLFSQAYVIEISIPSHDFNAISLKRYNEFLAFKEAV